MSFDHTFALCAYKENPHLEETVISLKNQSLKTNIIMITATPNDHICGIAKKHDIPLYVNEHPKGMSGNWTFAYKNAKTQYVTIAHEDDLYEEDYAKEVYEATKGKDDILILFTDYSELRGETYVSDNKLLNTKRRLNAPFNRNAFQKSKFIRNRVLSLGSPICCPSVTYNKALLPDFEFSDDFLCDADWDAWQRIAQEKGRFVYIPKLLTVHRIHEESLTTQLLKNGIRFKEDQQIFERYWPRPIAKLIMKKYMTSAKSNEKGSEDK